MVDNVDLTVNGKTAVLEASKAFGAGQASAYVSAAEPNFVEMGSKFGFKNDNFRAGLSGSHAVHGPSNLTASAGTSLQSGPNALHADAFHTKTFIPHGPTVNTTGGALKYMHEAGHGASLGVARQDLTRTTTYSGGGSVNLYSNPSGSVDLRAGVERSVGPFSSGKTNSFGMLHGGFKF